MPETIITHFSDMKVSSPNPGVLLFDDAVPKTSIKLSAEQKGLQKQITALIQSNFGKQLARDTESQRLVAVFIVLLNLDWNTASNISVGYRCFRLFQLSKEGKLITCKGEYKNRNKEIKLVGMDNYQTTTCYLDALIVSLFYNTSSFDFLLDSSHDPNLSPEFQQQIERLKIALRLIVNMLRAGDHINVNIMYQLLLVLNSLGCDMVLSGKQQDSLQAFEFLAESLSLPLLTLKLDIIHSGKLNVNDDLRLIGERSLLISIPTSSGSLESSITLEECLNSYFNNSITVRRHIDQKMSMSALSSTPNYGNVMLQKLKETTLDISESATDSKESLISTSLNELEEYERVGILTSSSSHLPIARPQSPVYTSHIRTTPQSTGSELSDIAIGEMEAITPERSTSKESTVGDDSLIRVDESNSIIDFSPTGSRIGNTPLHTISSSTMTTTNDNSPFATNTDIDTLNSNSVVGSFRNVNEKLERQRTRSSTLVSVLNNVQASNPTKITRRSSSISNAEVSLPAWMYLQLLPYYTDPEVKLTVENHEEFYRRRISRSKTIESAQLDPSMTGKENGRELLNENPTSEEESYFNQRYANKRPVVPICLKRYTWNERGKSVKINRKVTIPEIIRYPYFIAEDKTKPGFVDFKRSYDHKAPRGSFMLVLQSCVCHRGNSINSGHYVSIVRKKKFDISAITSNNSTTTSSEWIIFNDMEIGKDKAKTCTFEEAMEAENPYVLFYEIFEIKRDNYDIPSGAKASYWVRKPSVVSGLSGLSDNTLQEESSDTGSSTKHVMHLSLAGLALSKSKSKGINSEIDDVLDDYYWYDSTSLNHVSEGGNQANSNSFATQTSQKTGQSNMNEFPSSINSTSNSANGSSESSVQPSIHDQSTDGVPQVHVMEINESETTGTSVDCSMNGNIEYISDSQDEIKVLKPNAIKNPKAGSLLNILGSSKSKTDQKSVHSVKSSSTIKDEKANPVERKATLTKPRPVRPLSMQFSRPSKHEAKARPISYIGSKNSTPDPEKTGKKKSASESKVSVRKFLKKVFN